MPTRKPAEQKSYLERFGSQGIWVTTVLLGGAFQTGFMLQRFQQVIDMQQMARIEQMEQGKKITEFREKQIGGLRDIEVLKSDVKSLDSRVLIIERVFIQGPEKK